MTLGRDVQLRYMCATGEIGAKWLDVPDEMREAWRDLTRSAAQQACEVLALALGDSGGSLPRSPPTSTGT